MTTDMSKSNVAHGLCNQCSRIRIRQHGSIGTAKDNAKLSWITTIYIKKIAKQQNRTANCRAGLARFLKFPYQNSITFSNSVLLYAYSNPTHRGLA